jgi:hypothetical protein
MQALKGMGKPEDVAVVVAMDHRGQYPVAGARSFNRQCEERDGNQGEQRQGDQNSRAGASHHDFSAEG